MTIWLVHMINGPRRGLNWRGRPSASALRSRAPTRRPEQRPNHKARLRNTVIWYRIKIRKLAPPPRKRASAIRHHRTLYYDHLARIGAQRRRHDLGVAAVVLGAGHREAIAETVRRLGVDGVDGKAALADETRWAVRASSGRQAPLICRLSRRMRGTSEATCALAASTVPAATCTGGFRNTSRTLAASRRGTRLRLRMAAIDASRRWRASCGVGAASQSSSSHSAARSSRNSSMAGK
jgi:hypothetical protein